MKKQEELERLNEQLIIENYSEPTIRIIRLREYCF
jgi:hypothetical protein